MTPIEILYVDDDDDIRTIVELSLGLDPAIALRVFASAAAALDHIATGYRPDVVILDVMMPGIDGPETLVRLRSYPGMGDTPVIFMTAKGRDADRAAYHALGAIGVILKPFDPMRLANDVRAMLRAV